MSISIGTHLWMHWLQIGCERERVAIDAREQSIVVGAAAEGFGDALTAELQASMVAISAAAHAIDALYGEIAPLVPVPESTRAMWKANRVKRPSRIFETLKTGCSLGRRTNDWPKQFRVLYDLRDPAMHHRLRIAPSVLHPNGLTHSGRENADYCVENVSTSLDFAYDVVLTAITSPKAPDLVAWAATMAHVPDAVTAWRG